MTSRTLAKLSMYLINYELKRYNEEMDLNISVSSQTSLFYAFQVHVQWFVINVLVCDLRSCVKSGSGGSWF